MKVVREKKTFEASTSCFSILGAVKQQRLCQLQGVDLADERECWASVVGPAASEMDEHSWMELVCEHLETTCDQTRVFKSASQDSDVVTVLPKGTLLRALGRPVSASWLPMSTYPLPCFPDFAWEVPLDELVQGLRHMFALRDACLARDDDLRRGRSLDLWLMVLRQTASGGELHPAAAKILHSFLITQTQSAGCERTFARIEEIKHLWLRQFSSFCIVAPCGFLSVSFEPDSTQPFQHGPRNHMSDAPPAVLEQILLIGAGPSPLDALQGDLLSRCLNVFMQKERRMSTSEFVRKKGKLVQRRRAMRSDIGSKRRNYVRKVSRPEGPARLLQEASAVGLLEPPTERAMSSIFDEMSPPKKKRKEQASVD